MRSTVRSTFGLLPLLPLLLPPIPATCAPVPQRVTAAEAGSLACAREYVHARPDALLLTPADEVPAVSPNDHGTFRAACYAYVSSADGSVFERRFSVHVPDRSELPFALRAARFMSLVWTAADRRLGRSCERLREKPVDIWLTRGGEPGGQQINANLYVYNLLAERSGIEWARELAHEYGHYLLPGASGYTEPESWANGVLGERLFLNWLGEDVDSERIDAGEVSFVTPADLRDYRAKQVAPLMDQVRRAGPDRALLRETDRRAMNAFTGLMLYVESTYGGIALMDMLDYLPHDAAGRTGGIDFLDAFEEWVRRADSFATAVPPGPTMLYLPKGDFEARSEVSGAEPVFPGGSVQVARGGASRAAYRIRVTKAGWTLISAGATAMKLVWRRQGQAK